MAILAIFTSDEITVDQYEQVRREVNWEHNHPPGAMFHAAGFGAKGFRVADVWASQGEMDNFLQERLAPVLEKLNIRPPSVEVFPLQNINAFPTLRTHALT